MPVEPTKQVKDKGLEAKIDEVLVEVRKLREELKIFKLNFQQTQMLRRQ